MISEFITNVQAMREAQRNYFAGIAKAKKSKLPEDWAKASAALKQSKALEAKVDAAAPEVLLKVNTPVAAQ